MAGRRAQQAAIATALASVAQDRASRPAMVSPQAAQQESLETSRVKVWAVSFSLSAIVRYGAQVSASSATAVSLLIA